mmetsp:Transcript_22002/g.33888  ORF Transcript_22002/g.33888 Transcript_22002/m.33888 type:complete len:201 (-) Transcript_22002:1439-2041(-)
MILKSFFPSITKCHTERRILQTHPHHLYRIIRNVDCYSQFLPLCTHSKILRSSDCGQYFDATLTVGLPPLFSESYISRVTLTEDVSSLQFTVDTQSIQSQMFESLSSRWIVRPVNAHPTSSLSATGAAALSDESTNVNTHDDQVEHLCDVDFRVEMTVSDPIIVNVLDKVLEEVAGRQVEAFDKRCQQIPYQPKDHLMKQ